MKCIIHIGTPKTATTLLQKWLYENKSALSNQSIALTTTFRTGNNRFLATMFQDNIDKIGRMEGFYDSRGRDQFKATLTENFKAELDDIRTNHHTVLFTSEHLYRNLTTEGELHAFKEWLLQWFNDIQVICYVREQSALIKSRYSNKMKGGFTEDIKAFAQSFNKNDSFYNYFSTFQRWESVFSKEQLIIRVYDKSHFIESDIRLDFLFSVLPSIDRSKLTFNSNKENQSLTDRQVSFARAINRGFVQKLGYVPIRCVRSIKKHLFNLELLKPGENPPYPEQHDLYQQMNTSNVNFFEHFFGERRNLFKAPTSSTQNVSDTTSNYSAKEVLQIIEAICGTQGLTVIADTELDQLHKLTYRLIDSNYITNNEALLLLAIIQTCQPTSTELTDEIIRIRKKKFAAFVNDGEI
ncbi:hypothetical protein [Amphritea japonica]|uniref:Sulfotransferase domain-containing protein n=1 Tax=Amphritea japonica ATCC BAA-1530 TaxID=1278309 RepID=A0A7R6SU42_9GAMM|nr:hypothetical protein [Amphritea japonica]BBB27302.1 conserved hypothetical protein [Amphritea japonica ATCC BAA-1530]